MWDPTKPPFPSTFPPSPFPSTFPHQAFSVNFSSLALAQRAISPLPSQSLPRHTVAAQAPQPSWLAPKSRNASNDGTKDGFRAQKAVLQFSSFSSFFQSLSVSSFSSFSSL